MRIQERLRALDRRVLGSRSRRPRRRNALRFGIALGILAAAEYIGSFWDATLARPAVIVAAFAGVALGRVQEHDMARKGLGLTADDA